MGPAANGGAPTTSALSIAELRISEHVSNDTSDQNSIRIHLDDEQRWYSTRVRKAAIRLKMNTLHRTYIEDEPKVADAMNGAKAAEWKVEMDKEVDTLSYKNCWEKLQQPERSEILLTKFLFRKKRVEKGIVQRHKAHVVVCGNEEQDNKEKNFSLVSYILIAKLILCLATRKGRKARLIDFRKAFPHGELTCTVYGELPKQIYTEGTRKKKLLLLKRSLYGLPGSVRIWHNLLADRIETSGMNPMKSSPRVSYAKKHNKHMLPR